MEKILQLIKNFEKRNNISICLELYGDGSGSVTGFWDEYELIEFKTIIELENFLKKTQYKLNDKGCSLALCRAYHLILKLTKR